MHYWLWVLGVLIRNDQTNFYAEQSGRKWTRWDEIKTADGPLHTLWCKWAGIRYNWFTIGWHCWRKGHTWHEEHGGYRRERDGSYSERPYTLTVCGWCGKYRGRSIRG